MPQVTGDDDGTKIARMSVIGPHSTATAAPVRNAKLTAPAARFAARFHEACVTAERMMRTRGSVSNGIYRNRSFKKTPPGRSRRASSREQPRPEFVEPLPLPGRQK